MRKIVLAAMALSCCGHASAQQRYRLTTRHADEVAQSYVSPRGSKVARQLEELKGFKRVSLKPGETKTISMELDAKALAYWDDAGHMFVVKRDSVDVLVGGASNNVPLL